MQTELVHAGQIRPGDTTLREGAQGEIREQVLAVSQRKFFVTFRVSCAGKEYDMTERTSKIVRRFARFCRCGRVG
ncbi:hypothetical protein [Stutzerimonas decontaminans]|nr:hypothetical protein [Stutzerimonas decontaminans]